MLSFQSPVWGCPGVPVHGGIPIVFTSIHGVVTQFVNVSFLCVPVHEDTTAGFVMAFVVTVYALYEFIDLLVGRLNIFPSSPT